MVAETAPRPDSFYTPQNVETILRNFQYQLDQKPRHRDDIPRRGKRGRPGGRIEEMMTRRADVEWALNQLPAFTRDVVLHVVLRDQTLRAAGDILGCSRTTVARHRDDGLKYIAWYLGWRDPENGWGDKQVRASA